MLDTAPSPNAPAVLSRTLAYHPPLAWNELLTYLAPRATPGVEAVAGGRYWRTLALGEHRGVVVVGPAANHGAHALRIELSPSLVPVIGPVMTRLRHLLDLDVEPSAVQSHLGRDPVLGPLVTRRPGLRVPGAVDGFELATRAILGQQVSVRGATTLAGRLAARLGEPLSASAAELPVHTPPTLTRFAVTPERLADARLEQITGIGLTRSRAESLLALARAVATGDVGRLEPGCDVAETTRRLVALPGIGEWTAQYIAMRALRWPDAFPHGDLGLRKAMGGLGGAQLRRAAERWRPWRAYAAMHLWFGL